MMGISPDDLLVGQKLVRTPCFPGDRLNVVGGLKRLARGESPSMMLYRCGGQDGFAATWHEGSGHCILHPRMANGQRRSLLVCRDVSRRQLELSRLQGE